ncbi:MAG TPA: CCA tRNA nucleotidyltransferase [Phycisphaerales bacterium]|nr:CCA tRNA nucleotidyltransferase [Phycisphaerales bacterium]
MSGPARDAAVEIVRTLRRGGHEALLAGGCVRDELLGLSPNDYDVATDAKPEEVAARFHNVREVGKAFGVSLVRVRGVTVEVTTFRREHGYTDRRRPDTVEFCDAEQDARRRDFTINALFIDPLDENGQGGGRVIDYVGGQEDLKKRVIRAVGDPDARLSEDDLRALRAVRFAARLDFSIETSTGAAIRRHAGELKGISRERIGEELRMMFERPSRARAAGLMQELGLDAPVLDEATNTVPLAALGGMPRNCLFSASLAAWAVDRARAAVGDEWPARVGRDAEDIVRRWRGSLCLSNDERDQLRAILAGIGRLLGNWGSLSVAGQKRVAGSPWFGPVLDILRSVKPEAARAVESRRGELEKTWGGVAPEPLVNGDDLVAAGFSPGPAFAGWLDEVYDAQLEGRVRDQAAAMEMVKKLAGR